MKTIAGPKDVGQLGTILAVWAHPDDESFMAGGLLSMAVANGQRVICITATRGEAGTMDATYRPTKEMGDTRANELDAALKTLGIKEHHWLSYTDGTCHQVPDSEAVASILGFIERYNPDSIVTFPPDGITGHLDHQSVSRWSRLAVEQSERDIKLYYSCDTQEQYDLFTKEMDDKFDVYFNISQPTLVARASCDLYLDLPKEFVRKKVESLKAMESQTADLFVQVGEEWLIDALGKETFVLSSRTDIAWNPGPFKRRERAKL